LVFIVRYSKICSMSWKEIFCWDDQEA